MVLFKRHHLENEKISHRLGGNLCKSYLIKDLYWDNTILLPNTDAHITILRLWQLMLGCIQAVGSSFQPPCPGYLYWPSTLHEHPPHLSWGPTPCTWPLWVTSSPSSGSDTLHQGASCEDILLIQALKRYAELSLTWAPMNSSHDTRFWAILPYHELRQKKKISNTNPEFSILIFYSIWIFFAFILTF